MVAELGVHLQQAPVRGEVSEEAGLGVVCAVHLSHVNEGCQRVDLLPDVALTEHIACVARATGRRRAEERDAFLGVPAKARVVHGDLRAEQEGFSCASSTLRPV